MDADAAAVCARVGGIKMPARARQPVGVAATRNHTTSSQVMMRNRPFHSFFHADRFWSAPARSAPFFCRWPSRRRAVVEGRDPWTLGLQNYSARVLVIERRRRCPSCTATIGAAQRSVVRTSSASASARDFSRHRRQEWSLRIGQYVKFKDTPGAGGVIFEFQDDGMVAGLKSISEKLVSMGRRRRSTHEPVENLEAASDIAVGDTVYFKSDGPDFSGTVFSRIPR